MTNCYLIPLRISLRVLIVTLYSLVLVLKLGFNLNSFFKACVRFVSVQVAQRSQFGSFHELLLNKVSSLRFCCQLGSLIPLVKLLALFSTCGTFSSTVVNVGGDLHKATDNSVLEITLLIHHSVTHISSRLEQSESLRVCLPFWA